MTINSIRDWAIQNLILEGRRDSVTGGKVVLGGEGGPLMEVSRPPPIRPPQT